MRKETYMIAKELKPLCAEQIEPCDIEVIQNFWQKYMKRTKRYIAIRAGFVAALLATIILFVYIIARKATLSVLEPLVPLFVILVCLAGLAFVIYYLYTKSLSKKILQALNNTEQITCSDEHYILQNREVVLSDLSNRYSKTVFYHFRCTSDNALHFRVKNGQSWCYFDDLNQGEKYKLYCIQNKYILFVRATSCTTNQGENRYEC